MNRTIRGGQHGTALKIAAFAAGTLVLALAQTGCTTLPPPDGASTLSDAPAPAQAPTPAQATPPAQATAQAGPDGTASVDPDIESAETDLTEGAPEDRAPDAPQGTADATRSPALQSPAPQSPDTRSPAGQAPGADDLALSTGSLTAGATASARSLGEEGTASGERREGLVLDAMLRTGTCRHSSGRRIAGENAGPRLIVDAAGQITYRYRMRLTAPFDPTPDRGVVPWIGITATANINDLDFSDITVTRMIGDCAVVEVFCKETECVTLTSPRGRIRIYRHQINFYVRSPNLRAPFANYLRQYIGQNGTRIGQ